MLDSEIRSIFYKLGITDYNEDDLEDNDAHGRLVRKITELLCDELKVDGPFREEVLKAAYLHDIGKLRLSANLYGRNKSALHVEEVKYMRMHANLGYEILKECGYSDTILEATLHHHENYDGSGYPGNLYMNRIPLAARILRVADVFAALVSERPYRIAFDFDTALAMMVEDNKYFDMKIFLTFMKIFHSEEFVEVEQLVRMNNEKSSYLHEKELKRIS